MGDAVLHQNYGYAKQQYTTNCAAAGLQCTPGLGTVPILKWLFKRDNAIDSSSELLIFITPRIIKG